MNTIFLWLQLDNLQEIEQCSWTSCSQGEPAGSWVPFAPWSPHSLNTSLTFVKSSWGFPRFLLLSSALLCQGAAKKTNNGLAPSFPLVFTEWLLVRLHMVYPTSIRNTHFRSSWNCSPPSACLLYLIDGVDIWSKLRARRPHLGILRINELQLLCCALVPKSELHRHWGWRKQQQTGVSLQDCFGNASRE